MGDKDEKTVEEVIVEEKPVVKKPAAKPVASKADFLAVKENFKVEEFELKSTGKVVKIAPAPFVKYHEIISELRDAMSTPETAAEWELAWVVACMVEPEITVEEALTLVDARCPELSRLSDRCATISGFGYSAELEERASQGPEAEEENASPLG